MDETITYATKYRPKKLGDVVGNERVINSILATLRNNKPQVILISGPAGCGKTTFARLIAQEYMCEDRDEITGACGSCFTCQQMAKYIETGDSDIITDVKEIDVSDSGKKQDIDLLLEDSEMPSITGEWKVYILDECHLMSSAAQGRLLKRIEEPPKNVLFILCTTEPTRMLETIVSRCQNIFEVAKPKQSELQDMMRRVAEGEKFKYDIKGFNQIIARSNYAPRRVMMNLQKVVTEKGNALYDSVIAVLNIISDKYYFDFFDCLLSEPLNLGSYIALISDIKENMSISEFVEGLTEFTKKGIYLVNGITMNDIDLTDMKLYVSLFKRFKPADIAWLLDFLLNIKYKKDMETKLLLLGYTGINPITKEVVEEKKEIEEVSVQQEKDMSLENVEKESEKLTEKAKTEINDLTDSFEIEELANLFGGSIVEE